MAGTFFVFILLLLVVFSTFLQQTSPTRQVPTIAGEQLYDEIVGKYNKYTLPVETTSHNIIILLLLQLVQLTDIDEKNQIMTTTVWVRHEWNDANLIWNPAEYNNITKMQLPSDDLWLPDTVLYNNADGDYQITIKTKVTVHHTGRIIWEPPAIYKSFCAIDVKYFPFDEQTCELKFGPWSYDISKVDYWLYYTLDNFNYNKTNFLAQAADVSDYSESGEWDILEITGNRSVWRYPCCTEEYVDIKYRFHIRRKTLYYTVNLISPVLLLSILTIFIFYLPSQSGEKMTLQVSILVSMVFFILMLYEMIPPTSLALPLMCKYLVFAIVILTLSTLANLFTLSIHFRHAHVYDMPQWMRRIFFVFLPRMLFIESPGLKNCRLGDNGGEEDVSDDVDSSLRRRADEGSQSLDLYQVVPARQGVDESFDTDSLSSSVVNYTHHHKQRRPYYVDRGDYVNVIFEESLRPLERNDFLQALRDVKFISNRFRGNIVEDKKKSDWEAVARVLDRLFLVVFTAAVVIGSAAILASAPALYDTTPAITAQSAQFNPKN